VSSFLTALVLGLVLMQMAKTLAICLSIRWVVTFGTQYRDRLEELTQDPTEVEIWRILDETHGQTLTFGIREYRMIRWGQRGGKFVEVLTRTGHKVFDLTGLALIFVALTFATGHRLSHGLNVPWILLILCRVSCVLIAIQMILIMAEAIFCYVRMSSYGRAFHNPNSYVSASDYGVFLKEVFIAVGVAIYCVLTGTATAYFSNFSGDGIRLPAVSDPLFSAFIETTLCFVNAAQPEVVGWFGQLFILLTTLQGVGLLILVLSTLGNATPISTSPSVRGRRPRAD
jgi:hypothetical protein